MATIKSAFWDSSALVPLCCFQETSHRAHGLQRQFSLMIAWWGTPVEIRSAISRLSRESVLDEAERQIALRRCNSIGSGLDFIAPTEKLLDIAIEVPDGYGVRALDAFQLAAALMWCGERPRSRPFVCADKRLGEAAGAAGFDVIMMP